MTNTLLGIRIKMVRKAAKLTQQDAADKYGVVRSTWSAYEIGRNIPPYSILERFAKDNDVSVEYLVGKTNDMVGHRKADEPDITSMLEEILEALRTDTMTVLADGNALDKEDRALLAPAILGLINFTRSL